MMTHRPFSMAACAGVSLFFSATVTAQIRGKGTSPPQGSATAEELLEALRKRRPANEVIPPQSASRMKALPSKLLPEGAAVVERTGTVTLKDQWWAFTPAEGGSPIRLLPNLMLETMVRMVRASKTPLPLVVSGELTVFEGVNYLLVRSAPRSRVPAQSKVPVGENPTAPPSAALQDADSKPANVSDDDNATDVLGVLKNQRRERPVIPLADTDNRLDVEGEADAVPGMLDGFAMVDRPGRVVQQGKWWVLVFESDHPDHAEPPMRLLPCSGTELMVRTTSLHTGGVMFTVSGEVTSFFGKNYLLPRAVTRRFASGNLRK